jgi:hypothetical protein
MAIVVTGALYAAYLWVSGGTVQDFMVVTVVAVPVLLTALRIISTRG